MTYIANTAAVKVAIGSTGGHKVARVITRGGVIPDGVDQAKLDALVELGLISKVGEDSGPKPVSKMSVSELKDYAAAHAIDIGGATKKDELLAAIIAAEEGAATGGAE